MAEALTIAVDAMGGDTGAQICVPASLEMVRRRPGVRIILVGQREVIEPIVASSGGLPAGVEIVDSKENWLRLFVAWVADDRAEEEE